jgi:NAD(P)-dependent dehydrogenase (short-subunit alcohol dehydrogenase family)
MKKFPKKRVVITGSAGGLGRALAVEFAKKGWKALVSDLNMEGANETVKLVEAAGGQGFAVECDVTQFEQVEKLADSAVSKWGGADIIVNNAGVLNVGVMEKIKLEDWRWIIDINLMGVIHGCKAFIPLFKKQGSGHIVNIASAAGFCAMAEMAPYNVTKAGVISLSETLRPELAHQNIGISVACPTFFKTNLMDRTRSSNQKAYDRMDAFFEKSMGSAESVSRHIIKSVKRNKTYVVTQPDAKFWWFLKRHFPNMYIKLQSFVFGRGLLDKALGVK